MLHRAYYKYILLLILCLQLQTIHAATDFKKGLDYMEEGDYAKAFCLWEPLAQLGHPEAQYHLGWLYANGNGLNVDVKTAVYWWQQAANNNYLDAQFAIGLAYTTGEGIKADINKAFKWFFKAASGGHEDAKDIVKRLVLESDTDYYALYPELRKVEWLRQYVEITGDIVNLRAGPGTTFEIVHKGNKGDVFPKIAHKEQWFEVVIDETTNKTAWVYSKLAKNIQSKQ